MTGIVKTDQIQGAQSSTITIPSGQKLGIGTSLPDTTVDIVGQLSFTNSAQRNSITTDTNGDLVFHKNNYGNNTPYAKFVDDDGNLEVTNGNILFSAASKGIYLGVTSATAANLLDDYEEGSFTPALTAGTITSPDGRYVKIGKQVTVWIYAPTISDTSTASTLEITGLPFTSESTSLMDSTAGTVMLRYLDDGVAEPLTITSWMNGSDNKVRFYVNTGNGNSYSVVQYAHFGSNNVGIRVTHTYMAS